MRRQGAYRSHEYKSRKRSPSYHSWNAMIQRCHNPKNISYKTYGGRGIEVDPTWRGKGGFKAFVEDMGERVNGLTLDRIDCNGNYTKDNCRWATKNEQEYNKRCYESRNAKKESDRERFWQEFGINI